MRLARNTAKLKKVTDIGSEHALRGDTKGLSKTLKIAYDRGLLSDKKNTLSFLQNMIENINRQEVSDTLLLRNPFTKLSRYGVATG